MNYSTIVATALAALLLNACVGFIAPVPLPVSSQSTTENPRR